MEKEKQDRYAIHSIEKALDVIEVLSVQGSVNLIELAELVNQPKSSLYRIILTLEKRGFISRSEEDGKYCLSYKQLVITKNLLERSTLRNAAFMEMNKLVDTYGDTVNLCALLEQDIVYVEIIEGTYALRMSDKVGSKSPFHATATGKAISAFLPEAKVKEMIPKADYHNMLVGLADSISYVYQWSIVVGILSVVCIFIMGSAKLEIPAATKQKA